MAEDINTSASFGQKNDDDEELPIIVAQRFLNIFRQLHIFSDERREAFNKMLLELPPEVKNIFQSLPGGTPLQEYMEDLEQKSKGLEPSAHHSHKKNTNILQEALSENKPQPAGGGEGGIINGDNFARILASSLAQSNAEIIRELQSSRPSMPAVTSGEGGVINFDGPMKLVADESFTNIISKALSEAIESSEKKRLEDNKMIARSFTELQENLTKLIEQGSQTNFAGGGKDGAAAPLQMKGLVDDLVKAQSAFLKETTKNQKEELSSIIATAIQESQKVSTQALIESFKKIHDEKVPTPITYASSSPKGQATMESVEQALKAQGKEFSSIISMALKESQKNSAQTIIETLESLKKDPATGGGQNNLKVEEIMRMQANLFRDIARAQNQEFSALISSALKESQRQSTEAIIAALSQLQTLPVQTVAVPVPTPVSAAGYAPDYAGAVQPAPVQQSDMYAFAQPQPATATPTPLIDKYLEEAEDDTEEISAAAADETSKKKKKKKKKKNKETTVENAASPMAESALQTKGEEPETAAKQINEPQENKEAESSAQAATPQAESADKKQSGATEQTALTTKEADKPATGDTGESAAQTTEKAVEKPAAAEAAPAVQATAEPEKEPQSKATTEAAPQPTTPAQPKMTSMLEKLMTLSTVYATENELKDTDTADDWGWGYGSPTDQNSNEQQAQLHAAEDNGDWEWEYEEVPADAAADGTEGEDWEWEYEEVPADAAVDGTEGEDWEWEYEEVPADAAVDGTEGEDWEWEYEEVPAEESPAAEEPVYQIPESEGYAAAASNFFGNSEIVVTDLPYMVLLGLEDEKFADPYIENNDNIR